MEHLNFNKNVVCRDFIKKLLTKNLLCQSKLCYDFFIGNMMNLATNMDKSSTKLKKKKKVYIISCKPNISIRS